MDFAALGDAGFRMVHEHIHTGTRHEQLTLAPNLVVRRSTAPPAERRRDAASPPRA